jgi:alkylation response protein AidB-like acyl-CoA dehydrogenase
MDFRLTEGQELFRQEVARFVDSEVFPIAEEADLKAEFPRAMFRRMAELGYFGLRYPEECGGADADMVTYCLFCEEVARGSLAIAAVAAMQSLMGTHFVYRHGSEEHRRNYLLPAIRGEKVGTFALTEPNAGSDLSGITTFARRVEGGYRLTGTKTWVTNAPVADFLTVAAKTEKSRGLEHIALFLVDRDCPGVTLSRKIEKLGVRAAETGEISLDEVYVPEENLLGGEGRGVEQVGTILSEIRVMTGALSLGLARAAYEAAEKYARERVAFGKPIREFQAINFKLAEMRTAIHAARLMVYEAAWRIDQKLPVMREAAMTKLFASEAANRIADEATRIFASYGFAMEFPVQRYFRDARFLLLGAGTSEILHLIIGKD